MVGLNLIAIGLHVMIFWLFWTILNDFTARVSKDKKP